MELKQAAQDLKDLRNLRDLAQRKPGVTRYVIWGSVAVCTVLAAALSIALAVSASRGSKPPANIVAKPSPTAISAPAPGTTASVPALPPLPSKSQIELEISKLQDALRALAAERDRLVNRVDQLERSVGDITASISKEKEKPAPVQRPANEAAIPQSPSGPVGRQSPAMPPARPENVPGQMAMQQPAQQPMQRGQQQRATDDDDTPPPQARGVPPNPGMFTQNSLNARQVQPPPVPPAPMASNRLQFPNQQQANAQNPYSPQSSDSTATRTEFAIDLGGEASIDGLRALWANIRGNHGVALEGLRPLVSVRDGMKQGTVELRLVAGPLANAGAAARACAMLHQKGVPCQTTIFDGQRLALR